MRLDDTSIVWTKSKPNGIGITTVVIGNEEIEINDFCEMVKYIMENVDLEDNDPRRKLKEFFTHYKEVDGWNTNKIVNCKKYEFII